mmetsp:Transcript_33898/g.39135  ORF Transcript_33898/g.39135 Transcript_33898/m.39135 type:complete len:147 (+) Transcript_33898:531-971(+)
MGTLIWPDGQRLEGNFIKNQLCGDAVLTYPNGKTEIIHADERLTPKGSGFETAEQYLQRIKSKSRTRLLFRDIDSEVYSCPVVREDQFEGQSENGLAHGEGTAILLNGRAFIGCFEAGYLEGNAKCILIDGTTFSGEYSHGLPSGS